MILQVTFLFLITNSHLSESANVLFYVPIPSVSHQVIFQPVWKELSLRGHNVTVITPNPLNDTTLTNLTEVDLSFFYKFRDSAPKDAMRHFLEKPSFIQMFTNRLKITEGLFMLHKFVLEYPAVKQIIQGDQKFDLVITEWIFPSGAPFAWKFNCPLVGITSFGAPITSLDTVGNPSHPVYSPDLYIPVGRRLKFKDRLLSVLYSVFLRIHHQWIYIPSEDSKLRKYFGAEMPYLGDMEKNISLLLLNRNPVFHRIMPVVPAIVELGGVRTIRTVDPLNPELKEFLDNSKNGVIYFSLGSNLLSSHLSQDEINTFTKVFEEIPYDVVWKWNDPNFVGKPKNVFIQKWIPQTALLAHPNVKLFITQGGLQSMEETISNHVPVIGFPSHGDQTMNLDTAIEFGFGQVIEFEDLTVSKLKDAIEEVISNPKYKENVIKMDQLMQDRPEKGLDKAVWWIEYVLRHKGAKHLRSPSMDVPWYQYLLVDVVSFVLVIMFLVAYTLYKIIRAFLSLFKSHKTKKE